MLIVESVDTRQLYLLIAQMINKDSKLTVLREVRPFGELCRLLTFVAPDWPINVLKYPLSTTPQIGQTFFFFFFKVGRVMTLTTGNRSSFNGPSCHLLLSMKFKCTRTLNESSAGLFPRGAAAAAARLR